MLAVASAHTALCPVLGAAAGHAQGSGCPTTPTVRDFRMGRPEEVPRTHTGRQHGVG